MGSRGQQEAYGDMTFGSFDELEVRHRFVRKVYSLVAFQLLLSGAFVCVFMYSRGLQAFVLAHFYLLYVAMFGYMALSLVIACVECARRSHPTNLVLLFLCTALIGFCLGFICARYSAKAVLVACAITATVVLALTLFALQTRWDFTGLAPYMIVVVLVLCIFGIVNIFVKMPVLHIVYSAVSVLVFSIILIVDTQMMLGGRHKYAFSPEDYTMAALSIFTDIIAIFIHVLSLYTQATDDY